MAVVQYFVPHFFNRAGKPVVNALQKVLDMPMAMDMDILTIETPYSKESLTMANTLTLKQLHQEHKGKVSDKWPLYINEYDRLFSCYRDLEIRLLEIGTQNGGSLEIWAKYFSNAKQIVGCDINQKCEQLRYKDNHVAVVVCDANSNECEQRILQHSPAFDIIIDDGSHKTSDIVRSFARYFPRLNDGGIYIAEDLHCSYWYHFEGGLHNPFSSIAFFKRLSDIVNYEHWRNNKSRNNLLNDFELTYGVGFNDVDLARVHSVEFINSLCVIRKLPPEENLLGKRTVVGEEELVTTGIHQLNATSIQDSATYIRDEESIDVIKLIQRIGLLNQAVTERDEKIASLNQSLAECEKQIANLNPQEG